MTDRRMILCLGPHRSGTSVLAAGLKALGADLALAENFANSENQRGFFEHPEILAFNERLLSAMGGSWDAPPHDKCGAVGDAALKADAVALVGRLFAGRELAAIKDPRFCLVLPFWIEVLERAGFLAIDFVHALRDPVEAAVSQRARARHRPDFYEIGNEVGEGAVLWLGYACRMWKGFAAGRHVMVAHDRLVAAPEGEMRAMAAALEFEPDAEALMRYAGEFMDPMLWRSLAGAEARAEVAARLPQADEAFALMRSLADGRVLRAEEVAPLEALWADPATQAAVGRIMAPVSARLARRMRVEGQLAREREDRLAEAERRVERISAEAGRVTAAIRAAAEKAVRQSNLERARVAAAGEAERQAMQQAFAAEKTRLAGEVRRARTEKEAGLAAAGSERARLVADHEARLAEQAEAMGRQRRAMEFDRARMVEDYEAQIGPLRQELAVQAEILRAKVGEVEAIVASDSWRATAPLRALSRRLRRAKALVTVGWLGVNHAGRRSYRALAGRAPWLAEPARRMLSPVIHAGNRLLLNRDFAPAVDSLAAAGRGVLDGSERPGQFAYHAPGIALPPEPLVSVIVPNFNHARFLRQRLDSIFAQSHRNFEVILMDDGSDDDSQAILREYAARHPDRTRLLFNEINSGNPFAQWENGLRAARGALVWIAESDDWCSGNFLATLVPYFANPAVQLAHVPTCFMNEAGSAQVWSFEEYLADVGPERWRAPFVLPAPVIVREAFAVRNVIPNVSSALFRRPEPERLEALESQVWRGMRVCGDWVFYLNLIRGGLMAYSPAAMNFFRQHDGNTSVGTFTSERYYAEHEVVAKTVMRHYRVEPSVFVRQRQQLIAHWTRWRGGFDRAAFDSCYSLKAIAAEEGRRKPNLLMAGFAFAAGGGEMLPIVLANLMSEAGYAVTYLDCHQEPEQPGMRGLLASDIAVVTNFEDLAGIVRDFDIEVIHSHHAWVDSTVLDLLPEESQARTVITLHGMYETIAAPLLRRVLPRLARRTARIVYLAEKNTRALTAGGRVPRSAMVQIGNALPRGPGRPVPRAALGIPQEAFVLALVSRGIAEKGWEEAIRAVGRARAVSGREIRLVILGDGAEYRRLAPRAPDFVHFTGFRGNTRDYFAMADLGLLPSRFRGESFPLVLIDCLNAGRPMLATDLGEVAAMLTTSSGLAGEIFSLEDGQVPVEALAQRIAALAGDVPAMAELLARVPEAAAKFDPAAMRDAYDSVYRDCVERLKEVA